MENSLAKEFTNIIKTLIKTELENQDRVVPCQIVQVNENGTVNVTLVSDPSIIFKDIVNESIHTFKIQDYAYLYMIKGDPANAFIIAKQQHR